jgi:hypothetical protein
MPPAAQTSCSSKVRSLARRRGEGSSPRSSDCKRWPRPVRGTEAKGPAHAEGGLCRLTHAAFKLPSL